MSKEFALEIGPGPNPLIRYLRPEFFPVATSETNFLLLELHPKWLVSFKNKGYLCEYNNSIIVGDGRLAPIKDESISLIFIKEVLGDIEQYDLLKSEIKRICKPDGYLIIMESVIPGNWHPVEQFFEDDGFVFLEGYKGSHSNRVFNDLNLNLSKDSFALVFQKEKI